MTMQVAEETVSEMRTMSKGDQRRWRLRLAGGMIGTVAALLVLTGAALADVQWRIGSEHGPQNMVPGGTGIYAILAQNIGDVDANAASDLTITDTLPAGVQAMSDPSSGPWDCSGTAGGFPTPLGGTVTCTTTNVVGAPIPGQLANRGMAPVLYLPVSVDNSASGTVDNQLSIASEGGAATASGTDPTTFSSTPAGFGLNSFVADVFDGPSSAASPVRQAGSHPFEARFDLDFNLKQTTDTLGTYTEPDEQTRTIETTLPLGFVGNPQATPTCTDIQLTAGTSFFGGTCPPSSQIGTVSLVLSNLNTILNTDDPNETTNIPVFNMVPPTGAVADFAFVINQEPVHLIASLDPANHYDAKATISYATTVFPVRSAHVRLWGVPADPAHDALRYLPNSPSGPLFGTSSTVIAQPFLTLPSQCDTPTSTGLRIDSWQNQGAFKSYTSPPASATDCDKQQFHTAIHVAPTTTKADSPSGLSVEIDVDQNLDPTGLGTPPLKAAVVTLPKGMAISASSANGLAACTSAQIGLGTDQEPACPDASKIGTTTLETPLLPNPVQGSVYLATQNDNPFGSLIALYLVFEDKDRGLLVKIPGKVELDQSTGQVTTTFDDSPQLPVSKITLNLKGGPRAPLITPPTCGQATTTAQFTSWNSQILASTPSASFTVSQDGNGAPCPGQGLTPGFEAGTDSPVAGKDSPFTMNLTRQDGDQQLQGLTLSLPPGLLGRIASTVLCPEAAAHDGSCQDVSKVGSATVGAGPGSLPIYITNGRVYLTGPYKGGPFGLSIVVPAIAGPFNLGNVIVRAAVLIDRTTSAVKIVSDPLPTILQGIPLQVRTVNVTADRAGFFFNPTNCHPTAITGQVTGNGGAVANVRSRFQVGDCAALAFKPKLSVSVGAKGHTGKGASVPLSATVTMPKGGANLRAVSVTLPKTLNALLPVVNRACTKAQFDAGHCEGARVGTAVAVTRVLRDPLRGGVYFVKGKHVIPDLVVALRGQVAFDVSAGVTIPGGTRLGTKFAAPDVPISKFTLRFVSGKNGPLGAAANLCTAKSKKATAAIGFRAQNGALVKINQRLHINGCPKK